MITLDPLLSGKMGTKRHPHEEFGDSPGHCFHGNQHTGPQDCGENYKIDEDLKDGKVIAHHVTSADNIESIKSQGFDVVGHRNYGSAFGRGVYASLKDASGQTLQEELLHHAAEATAQLELEITTHNPLRLSSDDFAKKNADEWEPARSVLVRESGIDPHFDWYDASQLRDALVAKGYDSVIYSSKLHGMDDTLWGSQIVALKPENVKVLNAAVINDADWKLPRVAAATLDSSAHLLTFWQLLCLMELDRRGESVTAALEFFNPDQPRDYHGRWGGGTEVSPEDRIKAATSMPERLQQNIDLTRVHPDVRKVIADRIEAVAKEFPGAAKLLTGIRSEPSLGSAMARIEGGHALVLNEKFFGHDGQEIAHLDDKTLNGPGSFHPTNDVQGTIDHELGHLVFEAGRRVTDTVEERRSAEGFTRWALGLKGTPGWDEGATKTPVRGITAAFREMGAGYGAKAFTARDRLFGVDLGPGHNLNEGFSEWFSLRQRGEGDRAGPLLGPAMERIADAARRYDFTPS